MTCCKTHRSLFIFCLISMPSKLSVVLFVFVAQRWRSRQSVGDGGICPRLASGSFRHSQCGLGLGGRQERGRPRAEDDRCGFTQAGLAQSQRLSWSCAVSTVTQQHKTI